MVNAASSGKLTIMKNAGTDRWVPSAKFTTYFFLFSPSLHHVCNNLKEVRAMVLSPSMFFQAPTP